MPQTPGRGRGRASPRRGNGHRRTEHETYARSVSRHLQRSPRTCGSCSQPPTFTSDSCTALRQPCPAPVPSGHLRAACPNDARHASRGVALSAGAVCGRRRSAADTHCPYRALHSGRSRRVAQQQQQQQQCTAARGQLAPWTWAAAKRLKRGPAARPLRAARTTARRTAGWTYSSRPVLTAARAGSWRWRQR